MNNEQKAIEEFHKMFGIERGRVPELPDHKDRDLRVRLIQEELDELGTAFKNNDLVGVADAIADLLYVVYGAAYYCGIDIDPIFREVHRSNMSKSGATRRHDGKIIKPPTYSPPDIAPLLKIQEEAYQIRRDGSQKWFDCNCGGVAIKKVDSEYPDLTVYRCYSCGSPVYEASNDQSDYPDQDTTSD